ncbi:hypothetical protein D1872_222340 [compost metagenome]
MTQQYREEQKPLVREVKRKANVGERIKIVAAEHTLGHYENGDVLTIVRTDRDGDVRFIGRKGREFLAYPREYVVLEPAEPSPISELLAQFLRENAAAVRKYLDEIAPVSPADTQTEPLSHAEENPDRAVIIAKAKADVAEISDSIAQGRGGRLGVEGTLRSRHMNVEFHVNREKRAVTALLRGVYSGTIWAKATAKCAPGDVFHAEIGKAIALFKALGLTVPDEYLNAPQPDEPRVGAVVDTRRDGGEWVTTLKRRYPELDGLYGTAWKHTHDYGWLGEKQFEIIDDTDVDYGATGAEVAAERSVA